MARFDLASLLADLTLDEKASLLSGRGFWSTRGIDRLGIPSIEVSDGPHGLRKQPGLADHVGVGGSIPATCFPTASALGSSWDVDLVREVGAAIAREAIAQDVAVVLGPGINIKRSPRCGRNFEYLSEDPVLSGVLGAAMVAGIQALGVGTSLKHFAANNQETDRVRVSAEVDDRTLRELYLAAFERVVRDARPWTVMCSYNRINGVYASQDPWLLTELLRDEWGFDGVVVSDWGAVADPVAAVAAGLDLEMPSSGGVGPAAVAAAVRAGEIDVAVVDRAVARMVTLLERALPAYETRTGFDEAAHHALARRVAAECAVLVKNDGGMLPLDGGAGRLAVVGELARTPRFQGAGSSNVNPTRIDDALTELRAALPEAAVDFAAGYGVDDDTVDHVALLAEAVGVARAADTVLVFLGLPPSYESEGFDRDHIDLPEDQLAVLAAVREVCDRVVVVLANGGVVTVAAWEHQADAVLEAWLGGQAGGGAVADVLVGRVNPSGRLAETVPLRLEDTASHRNFPGEDGTVVYGERTFVGYRHHDGLAAEAVPGMSGSAAGAVGSIGGGAAPGRAGAVAYPFGHGLSYTTFAYDDLEVALLDAPTGAAADGRWRGRERIAVSATITNTGEVAGTEVVQLYVGRPAAASAPVQELRGFAKVQLEPGASTRVRLTLDERDLSRWSVAHGDWLLEPGTVHLALGASSRDLRLTADVELEGTAPALPLHDNSTLAEWLDHPIGRQALMEALRTAPGGDLTSFFENPEDLRMIGSFPLRRLQAMMGDALGEGGADDLLAQVQAASSHR